MDCGTGPTVETATTLHHPRGGANPAHAAVRPHGLASRYRSPTPWSALSGDGSALRRRPASAGLQSPARARRRGFGALPAPSGWQNRRFAAGGTASRCRSPLMPPAPVPPPAAPGNDAVTLVSQICAFCVPEVVEQARRQLKQPPHHHVAARCIRGRGPVEVVAALAQRRAQCDGINQPEQELPHHLIRAADCVPVVGPALAAILVITIHRT